MPPFCLRGRTDYKQKALGIRFLSMRKSAAFKVAAFTEGKARGEAAEDAISWRSDLARKQGASSFEVRSATDLARLWRD